MQRRRFVGVAAGLTFLSGPAVTPRTFVYKTAGCDIKADVYGAAAGERKPAVVYIHGGALMYGSRRLFGTRMLRALLNAGFAVISIDYRLAPESKLPEIIEDVRDAFRWVRSDAAKIGVAADPLAVCGTSAGAYLTLMTGFCVNPRPAALASCWGYGDVAAAWHSQPDPWYGQARTTRYEDAVSTVGSAVVSEVPRNHRRELFYAYCRQTGRLLQELTGRDPNADEQWLRQYSPVHNVSGDYPPTLLLHGTADRVVPPDASRAMAERLRLAGVQHEFVTIPGGDHGIGNLAVSGQDRVYSQAAAFLRKHTPGK